VTTKTSGRAILIASSGAVLKIKVVREPTLANFRKFDYF
jgi:hypothetical protein